MTRRLLFKDFSADRSVDGQLEGLMELNAQVDEYAPRMNRMMRIGVMVPLYTMIILAASTVLSAIVVLYDLYYQPGFERFDVLVAVVWVVISGTLLAINIFIMVLNLQASRFIDILSGRFSDQDTLLETPSDDEDIKEGAEGKGHFDVLRAASSLTDDVSMQVPQLMSQVTLSSKLAFVAFLGLILDGVTFLLFYNYRPGPLINLGLIPLGYWALMEIVLGIVLLFISGAFSEASRFMGSMIQRYDLIQLVKADGPPIVPEGDEPLGRFKTFLRTNDMWLRRSLGENELSSGMVKGSSGKMRGFDLLHINADPKDGYLLFVRMSKDEGPDAACIQGFYDDIEDAVLGKMGSGCRPVNVRAVLLWNWEGDEPSQISDEVIDLIEKRPILLAPGPGGGHDITRIQIAIDEGELYQFVPLVPSAMILER